MRHLLKKATFSKRGHPKVSSTFVAFLESSDAHRPIVQFVQRATSISKSPIPILQVVQITLVTNHRAILYYNTCPDSSFAIQQPGNRNIELS